MLTAIANKLGFYTMKQARFIVKDKVIEELLEQSKSVRLQDALWSLQRHREDLQCILARARKRQRVVELAQPMLEYVRSLELETENRLKAMEK